MFPMLIVPSFEQSTESPAHSLFYVPPSYRDTTGTCTLCLSSEYGWCAGLLRGSLKEPSRSIGEGQDSDDRPAVLYKTDWFPLMQSVLLLGPLSWNSTTSDAKALNRCHVYELAPNRRAILDSLTLHVQATSTSCHSSSKTFLQIPHLPPSSLATTQGEPPPSLAWPTAITS